MLREAAKAFPAKKGFHGFLARWFLYLPDVQLLAICQFLMACEAAGLWPEALRHALLHLIPKREGGKRPIGLVNGLCRLWELARRPLVREWRATQKRRYDYGLRGRSSTEAVWVQALHDEAAEFTGEAAATALLDLTKAFESVPLAMVWARGCQLGFPLAVLRLSLEMCAFARHLVLEGVLGEGIDTLSAILAGLSFATDLLFIIMTEPCDRLERKWPDLNLSLVVDDLAVQAVGPEQVVAETITAAVDKVVDELTAIGCMVSLGDTWAPGGKTIVVGTSQQVMGRLKVSFKARGIKTGSAARHLGVDYAPGRRGSKVRKVAAQRLKGGQGQERPHSEAPPTGESGQPDCPDGPYPRGHPRGQGHGRDQQGAFPAHLVGTRGLWQGVRHVCLRPSLPYGRDARGGTGHRAYYCLGRSRL